MAVTTINSTLLSLTNSVVQNLYIVDFPQTNVPRVVSTGSVVTIALDTATVSTGTSASVNLTTDVVTLQPGITFLLTAYAQYAGNNPSAYQIVNAATNAVLAGPNPFGDTLSYAITPATTTTVKLQAFTTDGSNWMPPSQITSTDFIIQAVSGFTT
jgi:hypothetical protein